MPGVRWFKPGILGALILLLGVSLIGGTLWATSQPKFCGKCHEMRPEYATWQASDHRQVACVTCHIQPGLGSFVRHKVQALNQVYRHFTGTYSPPIRWRDPDSSTCLLCHQPDAERRGSRDVHLAHARHAQAGIACLECHSGVAHGTIAERHETSDGDFQRWTPDLAREQMARSNRVSGERQCLNCHAREQLSRSCRSCHIGPVRPADHLGAGWTAWEHGTAARQRLATCQECHSGTLSPVKVASGDPVTAYTRSNVFCFACHKQRPASHSAGWQRGHGSVAAADRNGCLVCHNQNRPMARDRAATTYCRQCHGGG